MTDEHPRRPRLLSPVIFQGYPSRAQHYLAERLEKEGWFDETGWEIPKWEFPKEKLQPQGPQTLITVGKARLWAEEAWDKAYQMTKYRGDHTIAPAPPLTLDEAQVKALDPMTQRIYHINIRVTNFPHFLVISKVERIKDAVTARRLFRQAETFDSLADYDQAKPIFEQPGAFGPPDTWGTKAAGWDKATGWKKLLLKNKDYAKEDEVQEATYIFQHKYKHSLQELNGPLYKQLVVLNDAMGQCVQWKTNMPLGMPCPWYSPSIQVNRRLHAQIQGPFDDLNADGEPFIDEDAVSNARSTLGLFDFRPLQMAPRFMEQQRQAQEQGAQMKAMRMKKQASRAGDQ